MNDLENTRLNAAEKICRLVNPRGHYQPEAVITHRALKVADAIASYTIELLKTQHLLPEAEHEDPE